MPEANDTELLARFVRDNSEAGFAALAERYMNLVYSVARRRVDDPHAAEEITQAVFIILARKAQNLSAKAILPGWLHQTARLTAVNYLRAEMRRRRHEQEAYLESILTESVHDEAWRQLAPHLDEAIERLRAQDRDALILRFIENKSLSEVGAFLGVKERAAQKRVDRAVEKLRHHFSRRGVALPTAIIAGVVSANAVQATPTGLAATITATAIKGSTVAASTLALVKGTLQAVIWAKVKFACGIGAALLLAGGVVAVAVTGLAGSEERYQIEGEVTYHKPSYDFIHYPNTNDIVRDFVLTVNGRNWAIHLTGPHLEAGGIKYLEVVCLNGSVHSYWYSGKPGGKQWWSSD